MEKNQARSFTLLSLRIINHYDTALYSFLAPILGGVFFPNHPPLMQLILTYLLMVLGVVFRPAGIYAFNRLSFRKSPEVAAKASIGGIFLAMLLLACTPSHQSVGNGNIVFLVLARILLDFSVTGVRSLNELLIITHRKPPTLPFWTSLSCGATILGSLMASIIVAKVFSLPNYSEAWRIPFFLGAALCLPLFLLSQDRFSDSVFQPLQKTMFFQYIRRYWRTVFVVAICSAFSSMTFAIPLFFMNSYVPLVSRVSSAQISKISVLLLIFDMMFPFIAYPILKGFSAKKLMSLSSIVLFLTGGVLISFLEEASLGYVLFVQFWFLFWGNIFGFFQSLWVSQLFKNSQFHFVSGIGHMIGSCVLGRNTLLILLVCIQWTGNPWSAGLYVTLLSGFTFCVLRFWSARDRQHSLA